MIFKIARKEFLEMLRDGRFRYAAAIVFVLLAVALLIGVSHYRQATEQRRTAQTFDQQQWLQQGERNPHSAAHFGKYAFKPASTISFLDRGVNSYLGIAVWLEAHYQNPFRYRPAEDATPLHRFGELTVAVVLQLLLPLLIILLTFAAFAGEREQGTLRQLLSIGVKKNDLAAGKALGVSGALLLLLIPATLLGLLALSFAAADADGASGVGASGGRFTLMTLSYLLYFGAFVALALAVSASVKTARMALIVLLAFWIINGLVLPRAAADFAQTVYVTPSYSQFWDNVNRDMKEGIDGHDPQNQRTEEAKKMLLAQYNVSKVEDLPINFAGWSLQQGEEYGNQVFDKRYNELWERFAAQNRLQETSAALSPLLAVRSLSMSFAGTDFHHHRHFANDAETYRRMLNKIMNEDLMLNAGNANRSYTANETLWSRVPDFQYQLPDAAWALRTQLVSVMILLLWFIGTTLFSLFALRRMRVE